MNFGRFDVTLIFVMSLSIIIMSFTFPALGLTDAENETESSDIPEFNISGDRFDLVGDMPEAPGTPSSGTLEYDEKEGGSIDGVTQTWLQRSDDGENVVIEIYNASGDDPMEISYIRFDDTGSAVASDEYFYDDDDVGETIRHDNDSYVIDFEIESLEDFDQPNMTSEVEFDVRSDPSEGGGGLAGLPVIGGLFGAGEQLASMLGYAVNVVRWGIAFTFEISVNILLIILDAVMFLVDLMHWLISTYTSIISGSRSWASVFLLTPGLLLFAEFAKMAMLAIKLLPTT